jgi:hypothetical protein
MDLEPFVTSSNPFKPCGRCDFVNFHSQIYTVMANLPSQRLLGTLAVSNRHVFRVAILWYPSVTRS